MEALKTTKLYLKFFSNFILDLSKILLVLIIFVKEFFFGLIIAVFKRLFRGRAVHSQYNFQKEVSLTISRRIGDTVQALQANDAFYFRFQRKLFEVLLAPVNKQWEASGYATFDYVADGVPCRAVCKKENEHDVKLLLGLISVTTTKNEKIEVDPKTSKIRWILQHHGGGYTSGTRVSGQPVGHHFCEHADSTEDDYSTVSIIVDYRLAPEKKFPGAVVDAVKCFKYHVDKVGAEKIVLAGESAGGGLVLSTLIALRDDLICLEKEDLKAVKEPTADDTACAAGIDTSEQASDDSSEAVVNPMPAAALIFSPMLSCMQDTNYCRKNKYMDSITASGVKTSARAYVSCQEKAKHPLASPINAKYHDLPPLFITAGETEIFLPLIEEFASNAKKHVDHGHVKYEVYDGCHHSFQLEYCENSKKLYDSAIEFVREHCSPMQTTTVNK